jgi:hypothetical protein
MTHLVLTIAAGPFYEKVAQITHPFLKKYAKKCKADFKVLTDYSKYKYPHYLKCDIRDLLKQYDRIIYIDTDILVRPDSPNLFNIVPEDSFGIFNEGRFTERAIDFEKYLFHKNVNPKNWDRSYYNTGVFVCSRQHERVFKLPDTFDCHFYEQSYLNMNLMLERTKVFSLPFDFNRMTCLDPFVGKHRLGSYFVHYAGLNIQLPEQQYFELINLDAAEWNKGNYYKGQYIMILVGGGVGDRVSAEPAFRYACNHLFKNDNVIVICENPEFYAHLDRDVYKPNDQIMNVSWYHKLYTLHPTMEDHPIYNFISPMLVHACDLASINIGKMSLPVSEKEVKLTYTKEDLASLKEKSGISDFSNYVVVHPGKSWPSKTLPIDIWESYINTIIDKCNRGVVLIGKDIEDDFRKVLKVDGSRCLDLRNKITLSELIALISQCPVLLSNDSAPIHIAGAFDNWIGLIATCKHPDYILPHRKGSIYYKAKNLERIPMYYDFERRPTCIDGVRVDACDINRLRECCPTTEVIEGFINDSFNS